LTRGRLLPGLLLASLAKCATHALALALEHIHVGERGGVEVLRGDRALGGLAIVHEGWEGIIASRSRPRTPSTSARARNAPGAPASVRLRRNRLLHEWTERPLLDSKALLHREALVPDVDVKPGEPGRPPGCQGAHALGRDAIDIVVEDRPRVALVEWIQTVPGRGRGQRRGGRLLDIAIELGLQLDVRVGAGARDVAADQRVPLEPLDLLDLRELGGDVLRQREAPPRHPAREHDVDDHQHALRRRVNEDVARLVHPAAIVESTSVPAQAARVRIRRDR
jgi:hypothetical protein